MSKRLREQADSLPVGDLSVGKVDQPVEKFVPNADNVLGGVVPWLVSGRGVGGLRGQAGRLLGFVEGDGGLGVLDVGFSLAVGRSVFERRAGVLGGGRGRVVGGFGGVGGGASVGGCGCGRGSFCRSSVGVFISRFKVSQWVGMAVGLLDSSSVFAECLGECGEAFGVVC